MLRSMYSGISGMRNFQTKLDVTGNNIANVSTVGFKKGRVTFQEMMSQTTSGAQGATATKGGINPIQVGLGSQLGTIDNIHTQGFRQTTGVPLDIALQGDGMFAVTSGYPIPKEEKHPDFSEDGEHSYRPHRDYRDHKTPDFPWDDPTIKEYEEYENANDKGDLALPSGRPPKNEEIGPYVLPGITGFDIPTTDQPSIVENTGQADIAYTRAGNFYLDENGFIVTGDGNYLLGIKEWSEYNDDNDKRNEKTFSDADILDMLQKKHPGRFNHINVSNIEIKTLPPTASGTKGVDVIENNPVEIAVTENDSDEETIINLEIDDGWSGLITPTTIRVPDNAKSFNIQTDGLVTIVNDSGEVEEIGQIAVTKFSNPAGLEKIGDNLYQETGNSGRIDIDYMNSFLPGYLGRPGVDGRAILISGSLEMSNVDLAEEFSEMIVAQRGFQANTRIISTSDQILEELVNLKR